MLQNSVPLSDSDGSIGKIYVERTGKTIQVYEGESLDNLKIGAGQFSSTSASLGGTAPGGEIAVFA